MLQDAGDGSRGIVYGYDPKGGHVFNAVNQGGTVRFLDSQPGRTVPASFEGYTQFLFDE